MDNYSTRQFVLSGSLYVVLDIKQIDSKNDALLLRDDGVAVIGHGFTAESGYTNVRWNQGSYFMNGLKEAAKKFYNLTDNEEEDE
jgi:hypothetical protein